METPYQEVSVRVDVLIIIRAAKMLVSPILLLFRRRAGVKCPCYPTALC